MCEKAFGRVNEGRVGKWVRQGEIRVGKSGWRKEGAVLISAHGIFYVI